MYSTISTYVLHHHTYRATSSSIVQLWGFKRFWYEEMTETDKDVLEFILLLTTPVHFWYLVTSENRAWRSSFQCQVLWFRKIFLIRSINVPGYPGTTSRTTSPLLPWKDGCQNHPPRDSKADPQGKSLGQRHGTSFIILFGINKFKDILFVPGQS